MNRARALKTLLTFLLPFSHLSRSPFLALSISVHFFLPSFLPFSLLQNVFFLFSAPTFPLFIVAHSFSFYLTLFLSICLLFFPSIFPIRIPDCLLFSFFPFSLSLPQPSLFPFSRSFLLLSLSLLSTPLRLPFSLSSFLLLSVFHSPYPLPSSSSPLHLPLLPFLLLLPSPAAPSLSPRPSGGR